MENERDFKCLGVQSSGTSDPKAASVTGGGIDYVDINTR
jgi:predicted flavoprotein YhiN